jgi:hypothetical protein
LTVTTTPVPARTDRTAAPAPAPEAAQTRGSRPLAALLLAAPVLLGASIALHPDDTHGVHRTLTAIGGNEAVRWGLIHLLEPIAWLLMGVTLLLALPRMASGRGRRLLSIAAVFTAIGFPSIALIVYAHGEAFLHMAGTDVAPDTYGPLFEKFENGFPLAAIPSMLGRLGLLLAAIGLLRARTVPMWAAGLLVVPAFLLGSTSGLPLVLGLGVVLVPLMVALGFCARRIASTGGPALHTGR